MPAGYGGRTSTGKLNETLQSERSQRAGQLCASRNPGLGKNQGLFFPHDLPEFSLTEIDEMLKLDFVTRSAKILSAFIGDEIPQEILEERVRAAFAFPPGRQC